MDSPDQRAIAAFEHYFDESPTYLVRAPGRVNLIGEHTDYNDGYVLPMAIDCALWIALRPRSDRRLLIHALDFNQTISHSLDDLQYADEGWAEYVKGMAWALQKSGYQLSGWEGTIASDVPIGAGLSSSAALEIAIARAFALVSEIKWDGTKMAKLAQRADHQWVGVKSGLMDQLISAHGQTGHALLIDCRSLEMQSVPLPPGVMVVILDTATRRELTNSAYNTRHTECSVAAQYFGWLSLRDVDLFYLSIATNKLADHIYNRARHVITENDRTLKAVAAMQRGDVAELGQLMNLSHASLRDDYEVSSEALNTMVSLAQQHEACYGARMTGAGFGGCAVALVRADAANMFAEMVGAAYQQVTGLTPSVYVCYATNGVEGIEAGYKSRAVR